MATKEGFTIEISSRYEGWWRYNVALMCGCFDTAGNRTGFASAEAHVADVGSNLREKPAGIPGDGRASLETGRQRHRRHGTLRSRNPHRIQRAAAPRGEAPHQPVVGRLDRDARGFRSPVAGIPGQRPPPRDTPPGSPAARQPQPFPLPQKKRRNPRGFLLPL